MYVCMRTIVCVTVVSRLFRSERQRSEQPNDRLFRVEIQMTSPLNITTAIAYDRTSHYYAVGNSPPVQLIPSGVPQPEILCLASGDLRSVFFSSAAASSATRTARPTNC